MTKIMPEYKLINNPMVEMNRHVCFLEEMLMMECPNCKKQIQDGMKFCDNCGTPLVPVAPQPEPQAQPTPQPASQPTPQSTSQPQPRPMNWGPTQQQVPPQQQQIPPQQQYGQPQYGQPQYGQPQYGQPQYGQPQYGQPAYGKPKKSKAGLIIGIIVAILVIVGGVFGFLLFTKQGPFADKDLEKLQKAAVGDTITFGQYEQDNNTGNGKEDIEWQVLAKEEGKILLLAKKGLDGVQFNSSKAAIAWETSSIRSYCNNEFFNDAFGENEKKRVLDSTVNADKNPQKTNVSQGGGTTDKVFILSAVEITKYFTTNDARKCMISDYAAAKGAWKGDSGEACCWLRTMGSMDASNKNATIIQGAGSIGYNGRPVDEVQSLRPAVWVSTK